jgi:hypothetical protein
MRKAAIETIIMTAMMRKMREPDLWRGLSELLSTGSIPV